MSWLCPKHHYDSTASVCLGRAPMLQAGTCCDLSNAVPASNVEVGSTLFLASGQPVTVTAVESGKLPVSQYECGSEVPFKPQVACSL